MINSKYYDINQLQTCSISNKFDDLEHLIQSTSNYFDIIAVSESRLIKDKFPPTDVSFPNYSYDLCPTNANACDTYTFMRNHLSYKTKNDLKIYKSFELKSIFIEIFSPKKTCYEFNNDLNELHDKLSKENKTAFLLGYFNNLLNYNIHPRTNKLLELRIYGHIL